MARSMERNIIMLALRTAYVYVTQIIFYIRRSWIANILLENNNLIPEFWALIIQIRFILDARILVLVYHQEKIQSIHQIYIPELPYLDNPEAV